MSALRGPPSHGRMASQHDRTTRGGCLAARVEGRAAAGSVGAGSSGADPARPSHLYRHRAVCSVAFVFLGRSLARVRSGVGGRIMAERDRRTKKLVQPAYLHRKLEEAATAPSIPLTD